MSETTRCILAAVTKLTTDISTFSFKTLGAPLSALEPGTHIDVRLGEGMVRQYSPFEWSDDFLNFSIAVKREDSGRGGSLKMHQIQVGEELEIGGPRNNFRLQQGGGHYTMIAGGIGVTPIYSMARHLQETGANFRVYYLVQNRKMAAFDALFEELDLGGKYHIHCDDENGFMDFKEVFNHTPANSEVYVCGPEPMLNAVLDASAALRAGNIHFERFSATDNMEHDPNEAFKIRIDSSGEVFSIGPGDTILEVLQENGFELEFGCSQGLCGSCIVDVLEGTIDHRDSILTPQEQAQNDCMCICVSRAKTKHLLLDL